MTPQQRFKPTHQALMLALIVAAFPLGAQASAGRLDFVFGRVTATGVDGKERLLLKGDEINSGEAVNTAPNARAQIRFTDGAFMSLQPSTTFKVDDYRFAGKADGSEKGFFSLIKGGLRTITGAIGHGKNRDAYQVSTPAATIGIRGTGYTAQLGNSLTISVGEGAIALMNNGGTLVLGAGQTGYVKDFNTAPQMTFEKASTPPASLGSQSSTNTNEQKNPPPEYCSGCNTGGGLGTKTITGVTGVMARGSSIAYGGVTIGTDTGGTLVLDDSMNRVYYQDGTSGTITSFTGATLDKTTSGTFAPYGYDGIVGWGRWYGTFTYTENGVATTMTASSSCGLHGVAGLPATLPTVGYASYSLSGATNPTDGTNVGYGTGGSMSIYFGASPAMYGSYSYHLGGGNYTLSLNNSGWNGSATFSFTGAVTGSGTGSATVNGFFAGANAERIGIAFQGSGSVAHNGAAVFSQTSYHSSGPM